MTERVVLAYSGGLDTSVAIPYLAEQTGAEVIAVAVDVGQGGEDMDVIRQRALDCGAVESEVVDAREEFAADFCLPALRANALYMDRYPLVSALSRPLIVKHLVAAATQHGGTIVSHGCTGKGNDQVRFEVGIAALAPELQGHRAGPRLRVDPGQGDRVRRGEGPADRRTAKTPVLDRPEPVGPRGRDRLPRGHLERPDRGRLLLHRRPGPAARRRRGRHHLRPGRPGRDRRPARSPRTRSIAELNRRAGAPGRRPARHGRGPAGRHQEPRGLRGARRDRADHRAPGAGERHRRARPGPVQARRSTSAGASWSTTACGSRRSRTRWTRSSPRPSSTSPARSG